MNRNLLDSYTEILKEYSDYVLQLKISKKIYFYKFLRQDLFLIFEIIKKENFELILKIHLICLQCIRKNLHHLVDIII